MAKKSDNEPLQQAWQEATDRYPQVIVDVLAAGLLKANEVQKQRHQHPVRDEIIENLKERLMEGGALNAPIVEEIRSWER